MEHGIFGRHGTKGYLSRRSLSPAEALHEIKAEVHGRTLACGKPEITLFSG